MGRDRINLPKNDFIDLQCRKAGYGNLNQWALAIGVEPAYLYNLATRVSNVATLEVHMKLAESRGLTLDEWAAKYIRAARRSGAA